MQEMQETQVPSMGQDGKIPWRREGMALHSRIILENPMDRGAWWAIVHGVAESETQPSTPMFKNMITLIAVEK